MTERRLEPAAIADLDEIAAYVARDDAEAAERLLDRLEAAVRSLAAFPRLGHVRVDLTALPLRFYTVGSYLVVYRLDGDRIRVVRVVHAARDLPALLDDERPRSDDHVSDRVGRYQPAPVRVRRTA